MGQALDDNDNMLTDPDALALLPRPCKLLKARGKVLVSGSALNPGPQDHGDMEPLGAPSHSV